MPFTAACDLFGAIDETAVNAVMVHIERQRPSLFNYGTAQVAADPTLWCRPVVVHPSVIARGNPLMTVQPLIPLLGTTMYGVNYCAQLTDVELDLHPGGLVKLPAELAPPLQAQRFCLKARLCAGVGCPPQDVISLLAPAVPLGRNQKAGPPIPIPTRHLDCFCVSLYAIGRFAIETIAGKKRLRAHIDGVDIVEIKPDGLEEALVCYLRLVLELVLLPRLAFPVEAFVFHTLKGMPSIALSPTPTPGGVPNNPAVEKDRLEAFVDVTVTP